MIHVKIPDFGFAVNSDFNDFSDFFKKHFWDKSVVSVLFH